MIPSPINAVKYIDGQCRILASSVKEKISEKHFHTALIGLSYFGMIGGVFSLPLNYSPLKTLDSIDTAYSNAYNILKNRRGENSELSLREHIVKQYTKVSRIVNLGTAAFFIGKPICELIATKTMENPYMDLLQATPFLSSAMSMYLKDDDPEGLKKKRDAKEEKKLKNCVPTLMNETLETKLLIE